MTTTHLLHQLQHQLTDLRYREQRAIAWLKGDEQTRLYAAGALAVIQPQIADLTHLINQIQGEGITAKTLVREPFSLAFEPTHRKQAIHERPLAVLPTESACLDRD